MRNQQAGYQSVTLYTYQVSSSLRHQPVDIQLFNASSTMTLYNVSSLILLIPPSCKKKVCHWRYIYTLLPIWTGQFRIDTAVLYIYLNSVFFNLTLSNDFSIMTLKLRWHQFVGGMNWHLYKIIDGYGWEFLSQLWKDVWILDGWHWVCGLEKKRWINGWMDGLMDG